MKEGRPTIYTKELAQNICERISDGESVRTIVKDDKMPSSSTIFRWLLDEDKKEFWEQYEKSRNIQAEIMFEELLDIADDGSNDWVVRNGKEEEEWWQQNGEALQRSRLRVDTRKWYLSKVLPKKFGDFSRQELSGKIEVQQITGMTILQDARDSKDENSIQNKKPEAD